MGDSYGLGEVGLHGRELLTAADDGSAVSPAGQDQLRQKPAGGAVFAFRGRRGDRLKLLYWDGAEIVLQLPTSGAAN
ncbi:MAG: transposase [Phyllobacteriaceae bacterium]|nr:transposase [Phyllobacteriaceae bacterium]